MTKNDKMKLIKVFDKICKNTQYVQYFKGCRIISYNDPIKENIILQFHHTLNNNVFSYSYILNELYAFFDEKIIYFYYKQSLKLALKNFEKNL